MCFFEQLFHRNQSLGALHGLPHDKTEGPLDVLNIGLWLNIRFLRMISIINIAGKTRTRAAVVTPYTHFLMRRCLRAV